MAKKRKQFRLIEVGEFFDRIEIKVKVKDKKVAAESRMFHAPVDPETSVAVMLGSWKMDVAELVEHVNYSYDLQVRSATTRANTDEGSKRMNRLLATQFLFKPDGGTNEERAEFLGITDPKAAEKWLDEYFAENLEVEAE